MSRRTYRIAADENQGEDLRQSAPVSLDLPGLLPGLFRRLMKRELVSGMS